MRQWGRRLENPALFDIGRLRMVGDWGQASRYIGARWEELGLGLIARGVEGQNTLGVLAVCNDPDLQGLLAATGSKNPDVILLLDAAGEVILQPADFKWSLDVASYRQISAPVLDGLLEQVPRLAEALRSLLPPEASALPWKTRDGIFISPKTYLNQQFLRSPENARQEYPIEPHEVLFMTVRSFDFYEPLPGWETARELARSDGSDRGLGQIDTADRYYHLGAGVAGALVALEQSIFDDEAPVDPSEEVARLRAFRQTLTPPSMAMIVDRLGVRMRQRRDLTRQLRELTRAAFRFENFVAGLAAAGLATADDPSAALWRQFGEPYHALIDSEEAAIREAGRELVANGASDLEALERLEQRRAVFERRLQIRVEAMIRGLGDRAATLTET